MTGQKFKLAHKRADRDTWNASTHAQRRRLIKILQDMVRDLERQEAAEGVSRPAKAKRVAGQIPTLRRKAAGRKQAG